MYIDEGPNGETILLGTCSEVARHLGVMTNQVFMWSTRRERNGFPQEKCRRLALNGLKNVPHYDINECRDWHASYQPSKGGYRLHRRNRPEEEDEWLPDT